MDCFFPLTSVRRQASLLPLSVRQSVSHSTFHWGTVHWASSFTQRFPIRNSTHANLGFRFSCPMLSAKQELKASRVLGFASFGILEKLPLCVCGTQQYSNKIIKNIFYQVFKSSLLKALIIPSPYCF